MTTTFSTDQFLAISRVLAASEAECATLRGECESLGFALAKARSDILAASEAECAALRRECESLGFALAKARSDKNRLSRLLAAADARAVGMARLSYKERRDTTRYRAFLIAYCGIVLATLACAMPSLPRVLASLL